MKGSGPFRPPKMATALPVILSILAVFPTIVPTALTRASGIASSRAKKDESEFTFVRAIYGGHKWRSRAWATDFPKADRQFIYGLKRLTNLSVSEEPIALELTDPRLARHPFLYMLEVGYIHLTEDEALALRHYLERGGFLMIDDFWGTAEWANFEREIKKVFPERHIEEIPMDHPIFHCVYDFDHYPQIPNFHNFVYNGITYERDGYQARCRGIFDLNGRLMVVINWNTDLGDAWEWAEQPAYPKMFSGAAYRLGINFIVYAMTH